MSMLSSQADRLRKTADKMAGLELYERMSIPWVKGTLVPMLREAADTIISLRDRLQAAEPVGTCELVETDSYSNANEFIHVLECSACGETCEHVNGSYPRCPYCGAKAVER